MQRRLQQCSTNEDILKAAHGMGVNSSQLRQLFQLATQPAQGKYEEDSGINLEPQDAEQ